MDRELVERLAREAGAMFTSHAGGPTITFSNDWSPAAPASGGGFPALERFAALVAEECAKVAAYVGDDPPPQGAVVLSEEQYDDFKRAMESPAAATPALLEGAALLAARHRNRG